MEHMNLDVRCPGVPKLALASGPLAELDRHVRHVASPVFWGKDLHGWELKEQGATSRRRVLWWWVVLRIFKS